MGGQPVSFSCVLGYDSDPFPTPSDISRIFSSPEIIMPTDTTIRPGMVVSGRDTHPSGDDPLEPFASSNGSHVPPQDHHVSVMILYDTDATRFGSRTQSHRALFRLGPSGGGTLLDLRI